MGVVVCARSFGAVGEAQREWERGSAYGGQMACYFHLLRTIYACMHVESPVSVSWSDSILELERFLVPLAVEISIGTN